MHTDTTHCPVCGIEVRRTRIGQKVRTQTDALQWSKRCINIERGVPMPLGCANLDKAICAPIRL